MGKTLNYRAPLTEVHVRIGGRCWMVVKQEFKSLEEIRKAYGYKCVLIIER